MFGRKFNTFYSKIRRFFQENLTIFMGKADDLGRKI